MAATPDTLYVQQDFQYIPPINLVVPVVAGDVTASTQTRGMIYRNSTSGRLRYVRTASEIVTLDLSGLIANADIASGAAITLDKLAVDPLARANHTGDQLASTISNLAATVKAYRLDEFAQPTSALNVGGQRVTNAAQASAGTDLTTLTQVQNLLSAGINGTDYKNSVRVAVATNISLSSPGATLDGVAMTANDRVLLFGQTAAQENGIYVWTGPAAALTRALDADSNAEVSAGMAVPVEEGGRADQIALLTTNGAITLGTTPLAFTFISAPAAYVAGTGITITGTTISLTSPVTVALGGTGATDAAGARTNLGAALKGAVVTQGSAMSAGVALAIPHGLTTDRLVVSVVRVSDGAVIRGIGTTIDTTNISLTADVAVTANTFRVHASTAL